MFLRDLEDGHELDMVLLVREVERVSTRNGGEFLKVRLADRTGAVTGKVWDFVDEAARRFERGTAVRVNGVFRRDPKWGPEIKVTGGKPPEPDSFCMDDLCDGPPRTAEQMESDLRELIATVQQPHLRELLDRVLGPGSEIWELYRVAPAAKFFHQAYRHGLLEHSLTVAQSVSAISATFPGIDRDVAVTGALLHDIGKLEAYTTDPFDIDLTPAGRLHGEIPLGYYRVRRLIEDIPGFPAELAQAIGHIILSHHGSLEHGSPVLPATREATLVHMIDNLGGKLGSFDRIEKTLPAGQAWSGFDRAVGTAAYFAEREEAAREAA